MRYTDLLEYKRDITLAKYGDRLRKVAQSTMGPGIKQEVALIGELEKMDPTKNKMYTVWLVKEFINFRFRLEDFNRVRDILTQFHELKPRLPVEQRDINRFKTYHELQRLVTQVNNVEFFKDQKKDLPIKGLNPSEYELLYNGPHGTLVSPATEGAACALSKGTMWCTGADKNNMFDYYDNEGKLFIWKDKTGKYQFHFEMLQFMDAQDEQIPWSTIKKWRDSHPVLSKLFKDNEGNIGTGDAQDTDWEGVIRYAINISEKRLDPSIENDALRWGQSANLDYLIDYAEAILRDRWPKLEEEIIQEYSRGADTVDNGAYYSHKIYDGFWLAFEDVVLKNGEFSDIVSYARTGRRGPWERGEEVMLSNARAHSRWDWAEMAMYTKMFDWKEGKEWLDANVDSWRDRS